MHQNEQNKTDDNIKKLQQPNSLYFILNEPKEIFFNPLKKIKLGENNDLSKNNYIFLLNKKKLFSNFHSKNKNS